MLYRVKQFLWHFATKLDDNEIVYVMDYLGEKGYNIFGKLSIPEQKHSIRVAINIEERYELYKSQNVKLDKNKLIIAALLHDVGKSYNKLNVIDKSIIVILNKLTKGRIKRYTNLKKIDTYYNHAKKGANILEKYNYDKRIIYLVENHHKNIDMNDKKGYDVDLLALIESDSIS